MIFISGIHGVGKTFFCNLVKKETGIETYSASALITQKKHAGFSKDKLISDIDSNQHYLLQAVNELKSSGHNFILDGHFCLLDTYGAISRIPLDTFISLKPEAIVLLTEKPAVIVQRRKIRDGINIPIQSVIDFQQEECTYANEVAEIVCAKLFISRGAEDLERTIYYIKSL